MKKIVLSRPQSKSEWVHCSQDLTEEIGRASCSVDLGGRRIIKKKRRHTRCSRDWSSDVCSSDLMEPVDEENCTFTATVKIRMGPLFARLNRRQIEGVTRHMKEEGENLRAIVESKAD